MDEDYKIRELASSALMNLSNEISVTQLKTIFTEKMLVLLIQRLNDEKQQIVINSLSALQNLILVDFEKNRGELTRVLLEQMQLVSILNDMLKKFFFFFSESSLLKPEEEQSKMKKVLYRALNLLTTLCEVIDLKYLPFFEQNRVCQEVLHFLTFPDDKLFLEILSFLHVYAEFINISNKEVLINNENIIFFSKFLASQQTPQMDIAKVFIFGILYKLADFLDPQVINFLNDEFIKVGERLLEVGIGEEFNNLAGIFWGIVEKVEKREEREKGEFGKYYDVWKNTCRSLLVFLEVVLNLVEDCNGNENERSFETESVESIGSNEKIEEAMTNENLENKPSVLKNKFALEILTKLNLLERIKAKIVIITPQNLKSMEIFENHDYLDIIEDLSEINLLFINCFLNTSSQSELSEGETIQNIDFFFKIIDNYLQLDFTSKVHVDNFSETLLNVLKLLKILLDRINNIQMPIQTLISFGQKIVKTNLEESIVVILDLISSKFSIKTVMDLADNEILLNFLMEVVFNENIVIVAQTLNCLFDVYSDEKYDSVFAKKNMLQVLKKGAPILEEKVKESKGKIGRRKVEFLKEVKINLKRFIEYKEEKMGHM